MDPKILITGIDIAIVSFLIYCFIFVLRRLRNTPLLFGFITLFILYFIASILDLGLTKKIFESFISVIVIVLTVVFQREIRKYLEIISFYAINSYRSHLTMESIFAIREAVKDLAATRTGALILIKGHEPLDRFILNRIELNGQVSTALLLSIFDHSSVGHDGAVVIQNNIIESFSTYIALNRSYNKRVKWGTRHLAGLNITKNSDAFVIIISEERGTITVGQNGKLEVMDYQKFSNALNLFVANTAKSKNAFFTYIYNEYIYILLAITTALLLWFKLIPKN